MWIKHFQTQREHIQLDSTSDSCLLELQVRTSEVFAKCHALSWHLLLFPIAVSESWPFELIFVISRIAIVLNPRDNYQPSLA